MKIKPILFSTPMVKAIQEGRKTQTRRLVSKDDDFINDSNIICSGFTDGRKIAHFRRKGNLTDAAGFNPKYQPGDILWVRETCKVGAWDDEAAKVAFDYKASPELKKTPWVEYQDLDRFNELHLKLLTQLDAMGIEPIVNEDKERFHYSWEAGKSPFKWNPSIFMPKEACRFFLEVTNVRVERLQDISEEDAKAEGAFDNNCGVNGITQHKSGFKDIWMDIHGIGPWCLNPWVWVYDFQRVEKPNNF